MNAKGLVEFEVSGDGGVGEMGVGGAQTAVGGDAVGDEGGDEAVGIGGGVREHGRGPVLSEEHTPGLCGRAPPCGGPTLGQTERAQHDGPGRILVGDGRVPLEPRWEHPESFCSRKQTYGALLPGQVDWKEPGIVPAVDVGPGRNKSRNGSKVPSQR